MKPGAVDSRLLYFQEGKPILRYTEKQVRLGEREYSVIVPQEIDGFVNREHIMNAGRVALHSILLSMALLMENKEVIFYFLFWKNKYTSRLYIDCEFEN